ncbi:bifunctional ornithine acetyltransferase/N-acetylglutamate synthase [Salipaludibacillus keqinensis]|uniref:Arginine biosynthesis bifunctional protein ArgJ n=1 Tax=Salipaludibacillus keqinensis TaxID=2045207 RepID=A0A323TJ59_9BACI|nr:bifunctional glutamate N-acetyltransferase/amino-acid acetyltransferase ArgJ [Salipaludibacillus keqinensis]PYZ95132.1 bifunctional ornithine acetyltransferase/N-acetylglutamate synthase [Salipaludibacillus keqinensis]
MVTTSKSKIQFVKKGHVTSAKGFSAGGLHCGIRKSKLDFGWLHSDVPATAAGVYTMNSFQAAPLKVTKDSIAIDQKLQAIVVNSGVANSCTGAQGMSDALETQQLAAQKLSVKPHHVAVASTGLIGVHLPMEKISSAIRSMDLKENQSTDRFEQAILTTDTCTKHFAVEVEIDGKTITIGGAAKGSGMIHPNMATMLAYLTTDAEVDPDSLQRALNHITNKTFNMITVDGDCSTNDTVLLLANGLQQNQPLSEDHPQWALFVEALRYVSEELAKQIAKDGEGATKLIEVIVKGAPSDIAANQVGKAVISSNLVKSAVYGADPNWGRVVCAIGYSEQPVNPDRVCVSLGEIPVVTDGLPVEFDEEEGKNYLLQEQVQIIIDLQDGEAEAKAWGCDLTYEYVKINASYRT